MKVLSYIFAVAFLSICASGNITSDAVVKIHDDYLLLGNDPIENIDLLSDMLDEYENIYIEGHLCANTDIIVEAIEKIGNKSKGKIHVSTYGRTDDGTCH